MPLDVAASLPQLDLLPGAIITVTLDDPGAIITQVVVHGWQQVPVPEQAGPLPLLTLEALDQGGESATGGQVGNGA